MKYALGILVTFLVFTVATYFVLQVWDIDLISPKKFKKSMLTLGIIALLSVLLTITIPFFFKNQSAGYDQNSGNVAQSKKQP